MPRLMPACPHNQPPKSKQANAIKAPSPPDQNAYFLAFVDAWRGILFALPQLNKLGQLAKLTHFALLKLLLLCSLLGFIGLAHAEVALPNGEYRENIEEFRVQALGGSVRITREYVFDRWQINPRWNSLSFNQDALDGSVKSIDRNTGVYERVGNGSGTVWWYAKTLFIRPQAVSVLNAGVGEGSAPNNLDGTNDTLAGGLALTSQPGYRWQERTTGNWIDYDASGKIVSYGDKNNLRVWFEYGAAGDAANQIQSVRDHFGRTLITYTWANGQIVEIKDNPNLVADAVPNNTSPARKVSYQWSGTLLTQATDVMGVATPYTYEGTRLTKAINPENRTREITYGPTGRVASVKEADGSVTSYAYDYDKTKRQFYARISYPAVAAGVKVEERWFNKDGEVIRSDLNGNTQSSLIIDTANGSNGSNGTNSTKTMIDSQGRKTITVTDQFDNLIKTTYPDGSETRAKYSINQGTGILEQIDELGIKTTYDYDAKGNRIRMTEALGTPDERITEWAYNAFAQRTRITQKGGISSLPNERAITMSTATPDAITQATYDNLGRLVQIIDPENHTTQISYNYYGKAIAVTDARGNLWRVTYDARGNELTRSNPLNKTSSITWNKAGEAISFTDAENNSTRLIYNALGRVIETINPLNQRQKDEIDANGQLTAQINALNQRVQEAAYDLDGKLIQIKDANGNRIAYDFGSGTGANSDANSANNLLQQIHYPTFSQQFIYDKRDQIIESKAILSTALGTGLSTAQGTTLDANLKTSLSTKLDATLNASLNKTLNKTLGEAASYTSKQSYDRKGQVIATTDANGKVQRTAYDALGRVKQVTDPLNGVTAFYYDQRGNLIAVIDAKGNTTQYRYNKNNRPIEEIRPMGQTQRVSYDEVGNPLTYQDAKGNTLTYAYNAANRRISESHAPAGSAAPTTAPNRVITYRYNGVGTLIGYTDTYPNNPNANNPSNTNVAHSAAYTVDALQRRVEERVTYGEHTFTTKISYTATGQKASLTSPSGTVIEYNYDANQNLANVSLPSGTYSFSDRQWNAPQKLSVPGGSVQTKAYDPLMRPTRIKVNNPSQSTLMDYKYTYDAESNITQKATEHGSYDYQYDDLYRLSTVSNPWGMSNEAWTYDALGNRKTDKQRGGSNEWQVNANNQLTKTYTENNSEVTPVWDENGSLIENRVKHQSNDLSPELNQTYVYDAQNRLIEVRAKDNQSIAHYQYDPFGRRIVKNTQENTTYFVYSDDGLIAEANAKGAITTEYGWKPGNSWSTDPLFITTTRAGSTEPETFAYQNDHLGTPQKIIDSQGQIVWAAKATAFGETEVDTKMSTSSTIINNLRFPGQYFDAETKTHYNYFRDYNPATGTYRQEDPIGLAGGINVYGYVEGNPLSKTDPEGLEVMWRGTYVSLGGAAGVGGVVGYFNLTSECKCNKQINIKGYSSFFALGAGLKVPAIGATGGSIDMRDPYSNCPDPKVANGAALQTGVTATVLKGANYLSTLRLGRLRMHTLFSKDSTGFDISLVYAMGASLATSVTVRECCSE